METLKTKFVNKDDEIKEAQTNGTEMEPPIKQAKLLETPLTLNTIYACTSVKSALSNNWQQNKDFLHEKSGIEIYNEPYKICLLPNFLQNKLDCKRLVSEMEQHIAWSRKRLDLYEFYQGNLSADTPCLLSFWHLLKQEIMPLLADVTQLELDDLSISCSMYTVGDHLLVHDDLLADREIAFVYYLSPWEGVEVWPDSFGGCLELFSTNEEGFPIFPVKRKISPRNNQLLFFQVDKSSFHQVGEVTNYDYPRLTINGWFRSKSKTHAAREEESKAPKMELDFVAPIVVKAPLAAKLINETYLKLETRKMIQQHIEKHSEISLNAFLLTKIFEAAQKQLLEDDTLQWTFKHPANLHYYEVLDVTTATESVAELIKLFSSTEMFQILRDYTDLDLAGLNAILPTCVLEVQRWQPGNYTVISDGSLLPVHTLDLIYYLNAADNAGVVTYLSPEDDAADDEDESVLLTVTPVDNTLNLVYRCEGTTKFVKYISKNTPLAKGPVFMITCSYVE